MNNDQNKGVTGVAKTGTGILGNTVSGLSNTVGGVVGMSFFFFSPSSDSEEEHVRPTHMGHKFLWI